VGYSVKAIFKNDKINCSIFEDGLTAYLGVTPLIAETWGRPIEKAWCGNGHQVLNVVNVNMAGIAWTEQDDHSKWVLGKANYACFGDMNRMSSQWKRGGAFYCFSDPTLVAALQSVIVSHDSC
jgi:deoxyribonuclease II